MRRIWTRMRGRCEHPHTLVVTSVGIRRTVCEDCGHISFVMTEARTSQTRERARLGKAAGL